MECGYGEEDRQIVHNSFRMAFEDSNSENEEDTTNLYASQILNPQIHLGKTYSKLCDVIKSECLKLHNLPLPPNETLGTYMRGSGMGWNQEIKLSTAVLMIGDWCRT